MPHDGAGGKRVRAGRVDSLRMRALLCVWLTIAGAAGCVFDAAVPDGAQIVCAANEDCPSLQVCRAAVCIDAARVGDEAAAVREVAITPARAAPGDDVRVTFVATPLAREPIVGIELAGTAPTPFTLVERDGETWSFTGTLAADAGLVDVEVAAGVVAALVSEEGVASDTALGTVVIDRAAPAAVVTFAPAGTAGLGVDVTITIDANEPIASASLVWEGAALEVAESARGLDFIAFEHNVTPGSPEGTFTLASVELVDSVGNVASVAVAQAVAIDTAPPVLAGFAFDQAVYGGAARRAVTVTFTSDGPLAGVPDGALGTADMTCSSPSPLAHTCTGSLDDLALDEETESVVIVVTARDAAGNLAVEARAAAVDVRPPQVVSSFAKAFTPPGTAGGTGSVFTRTLVLQARVEAGLQSSELLPAPPTVTARDEDGAAVLELAFDASASSGNSFIFRRTIDAPIAAGVVTLEARLEDRGGNVELVTLPDSTFTVVEVAEPPCLAVDASGAVLCTDFDGDGHSGVSAQCGTGDDCDDTRALVRPGAVDIAGNGVDDDCDGDSPSFADLAPGEAIFLAPDGASSCASSSPLAPCGDLDEAIAAAAVSGAPIYAQTGTFVTAGSRVLRTSLIGGFDAGFVVGAGVTDVIVLAPVSEVFLVDSATPTRIEGLRLSGPMCAGIFSTFSTAILDVGRVHVDGFGHPDACGETFAQGIAMDRPGVIAGVELRTEVDANAIVEGVKLDHGVRLVDARMDLFSTRDVDAIVASFDGAPFIARVDVFVRGGGRASGVRADAGFVVLASSFDVSSLGAVGVHGAFATPTPGPSTLVHTTVRVRESSGGGLCAHLAGAVDVRGVLCVVADEPVGFAAAFNVDSTATPTYEAVFVEGTTCIEQSAATGVCSSLEAVTSVADAGLADATRASIAFASPLIGAAPVSLLDEATSTAAIDLNGTCRGAADLEPGADEL
jgi:hypothetical protein